MKYLAVTQRNDSKYFASSAHNYGADALQYITLFTSTIKKSINKIQGHKLKCALEKLGPVFIKFGQSISSRTDVLNEDITNNLLLICDRLPSFSHKIAVKTIESEFNCKLSDIFSSFSEEPIAAASISQVHRAVTTEGKEVAVKVLRPNIEKTFSRDIKMLSWLAEIAEKFSEQSKRLRPIELVKTFAEICRLELDLRFEAAHSSELKENTKNDRGFYVPEIDWNRTAKKVLTLEWIEATPIYEVEKLNNHKQIAINLIESFCNQVYRDCFFHADMHPGNLMVDSNNNIIALDCGIMGRIDRETCYYVIEILKGFLNRDYDHVAKMHFKAGYVSSQHRNFVTACRAIGEPIIGQPIQKISFASLLAQLLKITGDFDMKVQTQLLLLQKTMILLEGTCRKIYPEINMWKVVEAWISSQHESKIGYREKIRSSYPVKTIQGIFSLIEKLNLIADKKLENIQIKNKSNGKVYFLLWFVIIILIVKLLIS